MEIGAGLYLVATPIGTAADITLRAIEVLKTADILAAEDTRRARSLLEIHGIPLNRRPLLPYHDHNGAAQRPKLLAMMQAGKSVAYVSDAGTPLIADPGYRLAADAIAAGLPVTAAPGASALLAALSVAGLPTDRFLFAGFPPVKSAARKAFLQEIATVPATLVFYESPKRLAACLQDMSDVLGGGRGAAICRELTKKFEETTRDRLDVLAIHYSQADTPKGEIVVVVGPPLERRIDDAAIDDALRAALEGSSVRDAVAFVSDTLGVARKKVYARALGMEKNGENTR